MLRCLPPFSADYGCRSGALPTVERPLSSETPLPMWTPERERRQFELVWKWLWPAFGAVFGLTLGGLVGGALAGLPGALLAGAAGIFIGAELGHVFGLLLLLIFRPWVEFFESGKLAPLVAGSIASALIAMYTLRVLDDTGLAIFVSCLGFAVGDILAFAVEAARHLFRRADPPRHSPQPGPSSHC